MSRLRLLSRQLKIALLALAGWLALHAAALAQAAGQPAAKKDSSTTGTGPYVMAYLLLILGHCPGHVGRLPLEQPPRPRPARGLRRDARWSSRKRRNRSRKRRSSP